MKFIDHIVLAVSDIIVDRLLLDGAVENYEFLNKSRREVDGVDDKEEWKQLNVRNSTVAPNATY